MRLQKLRNLHQGKTIFVFGSGPELAGFTPEQIAYLQTQITITANWSFLIFPQFDPTYWVGSHHGVLSLAAELCPEQVTKICIADDGEQYPGFHTFKRFPYDSLSSLASANAIPSIGNVMFTAIFLAWWMGAKRIVIFGLEMENGLYFFHSMPELSRFLHRKIRQMIRAGKHIGTKGRRELVAYIRRKFDIQRRTDMRYPDLSDGFYQVIEEIMASGTEVCYTAKSGIMTKSGAKQIEKPDV